MERKDMVKKLRSSLRNNAIRLPEGIGLAMQGDTLTMQLHAAAVGLTEKLLNMQRNAAAFEGWALAFYAHLLEGKGRILLNAPMSAAGAMGLDGGMEHYRRFLYRAMKFQMQFPWFSLAPEVAYAVEQLRQDFKTNVFVNNIPLGAAGSNRHLENRVETLFAEEQSALLRSLAAAAGVPIGENPIYRQLPVGLFQGKMRGGTSVFSGKKSAIDLWTRDGSTLAIFELKVNQKMVGIVTELFFYANYIYDVFCDKACTFHPLPPHNVKEDRGYRQLLDGESQKNCENLLACFLYNDAQLHPLVSVQVLALLNQGMTKIRYAVLSYPLAAMMLKRETAATDSAWEE